MVTNRWKLQYAATAAILVLILIVMFYHTRNASTAPTSKAQVQNLPTLDYDSEISKPKSSDRRQKDARFKGRGNPGGRPITELPNGVEPLPINGHWWVGLSAMPVDQSDAVVLGTVGGSEAHLSDDRTGIYSEYSFVVSEIFKDTTGSISSGSIPVNRLGGAVRFKSGRVQRYEIFRQGAPQTGAQYVFFLRRTDDGDLLLLTGYEFSNGRVIPLDGEQEKDPRMALPFSKYRNATESDFLKDLREATGKKTEEVTP